jgi:uncharacterized sulfatase
VNCTNNGGFYYAPGIFFASAHEYFFASIRTVNQFYFQQIIAGGVPDEQLDGRSFLQVLQGETAKHKDYVFGLQTSRGIISGPDHYGIRTVRSENYRYLVNLTPEAAFQCVATSDEPFNSWQRKGKTDEQAAELVHKYLFRPAEELYDLQKDPYELNNVANDPNYQEIKESLKTRLYSWMEQQGDRGQATEMDALNHSTMAGKELNN